MVSKEEVLDALRSVKDPEMGMSVVDLGLVYDVTIDAGNNISVRMTMTTPACPLIPIILQEAEAAVKRLEGAGEVRVELVWDPPWTPARMSDEAKAQLGFM